jgi:hypothetical protein
LNGFRDRFADMRSGLSQPLCEKVGFVYARYFVDEVTATTTGGGNADI